MKIDLRWSSQVATLPRSEEEAEYLSKRKFTLVNGMHTVMAFITLINDFSGIDQEYVLNKYTRMSKSDQRMVQAWRCARIAELMDEFSMDDLMAWHQKQTREEVNDPFRNKVKYT